MDAGRWTRALCLPKKLHRATKATSHSPKDPSATLSPAKLGEAHLADERKRAEFVEASDTMAESKKEIEFLQASGAGQLKVATFNSL
jgi:hypothetical protein